MTFAIVLLFIVASLVVEGTSFIVSRLEEVKKELYTLRLVGDTLLSRTAQLLTDASSAEALEDRESLYEEYERQQQYDDQVKRVHEMSDFKHIPGQPWGDPSSYVTAQQCQETERLEQSAREFLTTESERILREREERTQTNRTKLD